jgi:hypothetical protein
LERHVDKTRWVRWSCRWSGCKALRVLQPRLGQSRRGRRCAPSRIAVAAGLLVCEIGVWVSQASEIVQMNLIPLGKELLFE